MRAAISYDLVMEEAMDFVEGVYRLPGEGWKVFIFSRDNVDEPCPKPTEWASGETGMVVRFPRESCLNREAVEQVLSAALGVREWVDAGGPDSMQLR
jgi:hypothetical protein